MSDNDKTPKKPDGGLPNGMFGPGSNKRWIWILLPLMFFLPMLTTMFTTDRGTEISYTEFLNQVERGNVAQVTIFGHQVQGRFRQAVDTGGGTLFGQDRLFTTYVPPFGDDRVLESLRENNVVIVTRPPREPITFFGVLFNILPLVLLVWIGMTIFRSMKAQGRGIFNVGQNKAKLYDQDTKVKTKFKDVAGLHGVKEEVEELVDYLKNPQDYAKLGGQTPKGVLLIGPPGTGKTLMARAIAGEAGVPFFSMSGSDFMEMFVGVGASRVRSLFQDARKQQPSIIFIDELDSVGRHRGAGLGGGHDEREQTLNQMLSELDGFDPTETVIVLAATNRPDILDPALLRPGRFDRRVTTHLPSVKDREEILAIHAQGKPMADSVSLAEVAKQTPGFSGADLKNLLNEAALLAAKKKQDSINMVDIVFARDKVMLGLERKNMTVSADERKIVAYHEAGHAVTAAMLPNTDPVLKVTIIPRERSMGMTQQMPDEEKYLYSRDYLNDRIAVILGGRAAEQLVFDSITNGAQSDLEQATKIARKMVTDWGMSDVIGPFSSGEKENIFLGEELSKHRDYSESTGKEIDNEVFAILRAAQKKAKETLEKYREGLNKLAEELLDKEELGAEDVKRILNLA